jgi:hypothetical protein
MGTEFLMGSGAIEEMVGDLKNRASYGDHRIHKRRDMRSLSICLTNLTNLTKLSIMFFEVHHAESKDQIADRYGGAS